MEKNDTQEDRQGYYCVIPWKLLTDKSIPSTAKLIYGEISALANREGFCWASNEHFSETFGLKANTTISRLINILKDAKYIYVDIDVKAGNKRRIYLQGPIIKNEDSYHQKSREAIIKNRDKNNHINKQIINNNKKEEQLSITGKETNDLIALFESVNPSYERLFPNKGQRSALDRLIKKHGYKKIKWIIDKLPEISKMSYAPVVTTPYQLEQKLGQLVIFLGRENNKEGGITDARNIE